MSSVLIVEDDATLREFLFELFSGEYSCSAADSAEEALSRLNSEHFDVVITDVSMSGMSGLELLGNIRQRWPEISVIIISGIRDKEYAEGLVRMGAFDYLVKPFELVDVYQSVARALEQQGQSPVGQQKAESTTSGEGEKGKEPTEVFSSIRLEKVFSLSELLELAQRSRMSGYIDLRWDESTLKEADRTGRFKDASGSFDEALKQGTGTIYLHDGLMIDATIADTEASPYWREAEQSLVLLVRLATWVRVGLGAWGFITPEMSRVNKLSVSDNSGKIFGIITAEEESQNGSEEGVAPEETVEEKRPLPQVADPGMHFGKDSGVEEDASVAYVV
ncbi:MAG: response regulator [Acidobacteria bacterium]|nr:response regulator [Acidobacteriota bacterium]